MNDVISETGWLSVASRDVSKEVKERVRSQIDPLVKKNAAIPETAHNGEMSS